MEQFRHVGEVLGSLKALMVLQDDIQINPRQCVLLLQMFTSAFDTIAEEIKHNLTLEEKNTKWKPLEEPLRELHRVFKEGELYVRHCMDYTKDWWGKSLSLHQNKDSVEFHIHNLLTCLHAVVEAIESAGEISGLDEADMKRKRVMLSKKYDRSWYDPKLFQWRFGRQYLIPREICCQFKAALREDKWHLIEKLKEKKASGGLISKNEHRLADLLLKKLNGIEKVNGKLPPSSILLGAEDYKVRRRLGEGSQYKEIQWLGEGFAMRHLFHEIEPLSSEIYDLMSLAHPNIVQYFCGFYDEDKKECFLVMELMSKDLYSYMKENSSPRKRVLLPLPIVVDIMLQVARGMEYLHSKKIYHGDLNITNIFLKPRKSTEGYFLVKVSGFGLSRVESQPLRHASSNSDAIDPTIWYAPEVLAEQEAAAAGGNKFTSNSKYTEKADVYSFGMLSFGLLTGKLPFEDGHLHGDQMIKNIRAGERPLFPFLSPKYLVNLTKKCWHTDPSCRPSFSSICRVLRYVKKFLVMNPSDGQPDMQTPPVDYTELEAGFLKKFPAEMTCDSSSVSQIPFQMFAYRLAEREKMTSSFGVKFKSSEAGNEEPLTIAAGEDPFVSAAADESKAVHFDAKSVCVGSPEKMIMSDVRSVISEPPKKETTPAAPVTKKPANVKVKKTPGVKPKVKTPVRSSPVRSSATWSPTGRSLKTNAAKDSPFGFTIFPSLS